MELRHLRYFVAVAEELNFRRAAARLNMSQPPLSLQIQQLEREVGGKLLNRGQQRVALTATGRVFLDHARQILADVASSIAAVAAAEGGIGGTLSIGFTPSAEFQPFLARTIKRFREEQPSVALRLREMASSEQLEAIERSELDVGISREPRRRTSSRVSVTQIFRDGLVAAVPNDWPLAQRSEVGVANLRDHPFISLSHDSGTGLRPFILDLCLERGFSPSIVQEARELPTVVALVSAGLGIAIVPSAMRCIAVAGVRYLDIKDDAAHPPLYLIHDKESKSVSKARFLELLHQTVEALT